MNGLALPAAAQQFLDAANAEDRAALLAAFADDATVDDFGRLFTGGSGIGGWSDRENIGTHNRITVQRVSETDRNTLAEITVAGAGYNGRGTFEFRLAPDGRIQQLIIRG